MCNFSQFLLLFKVQVGYLDVHPVDAPDCKTKAILENQDSCANNIPTVVHLNPPRQQTHTQICNLGPSRISLPSVEEVRASIGSVRAGQLVFPRAFLLLAADLHHVSDSG